MAQNPIAHYPFDNSANDISANKNNGKIIGGVKPTYDRFGNACGALNFDGTSGFIEVPNSNSLQALTQNFSVTCWFKIENVTMLNGIKWVTLICKGNQSVETPSNPQFRVQTLQSALQSTISINTDFTEYDNNFSMHPFEFSKWNFYALTYDGHFVKVYLNNVNIWEFAYSKPLNKNSDPMHIAKDIPGSMEFFCGSLDDLRIFNTDLIDSDISKIYNDATFASYEDEFSLICPANIIVYTEKDKCTALANYPNPDLKENCGKITMTQVSGLPSGSEFPVGTSFISFEASSNTGYKKTCLTKIIVIDKEPPLVYCPPDTLLIITDDNINEVNFQYPIPKALDKCSQAKVSLVSAVPSGSSFPIGTTQLKFRATDNSGNIANCNYNVIVKKNPVVVPRSTLVSPDSIEIKQILIPDSIKFTKRMEFNNCLITVLMYDNCQQDYDSISVFFNGKEIVKREMIKVKKKGTINRVLILNENESNEFIVKAWNNGNVSPNTLQIDFYQGYFIDKIRKLKRKKPDFSRILYSKPGVAAGINLHCKSK